MTPLVQLSALDRQLSINANGAITTMKLPPLSPMDHQLYQFLHWSPLAPLAFNGDPNCHIAILWRHSWLVPLKWHKWRSPMVIDSHHWRWDKPMASLDGVAIGSTLAPFFVVIGANGDKSNFDTFSCCPIRCKGT
jgi:hypothetical protein